MILAISLAVIICGVFCWIIVRSSDDRDYSRSIETDCEALKEFMKGREL